MTKCHALVTSSSNEMAVAYQAKLFLTMMSHKNAYPVCFLIEADIYDLKMEE